MAHLPYEFTATFTNASANVTAAAALFVTNLRPGDLVRGPDDKMYGVQTVGPLQTQFTLDRNYLGATVTAAAKAFRHSDDWGNVADANVRLANIETALALGYLMQSSSSLAVGAGVKVFTGVASGLPIGKGITLKASSRADPTKWMSGICDYSGSTLTMTVVAGGFNGSGTFADWNINLTGGPGVQGPQGDVGPAGGLSDLASRQSPYFSSDFVNASSPNGPFLVTPVSSGGASIFGGQSASSHGVLFLSSSSTANSGVLVSTAQNLFVVGGGEQYDAYLYWFGTATTTARIGFHDSSTSADATDGVYFEITGTGGIFGKTASNGTRSTTAAIVASASAAYYHLRIKINAAGTLVTFEVFNGGGTLLGSQTLSTNIPTVSGRDFGAGVIATNSNTTPSNMLGIDYMGYGVPGRTLTRGALT